MFERFFISTFMIKQLRQDPAGRLIEGLAQEMWNGGYAQLSARRYIRAVAHFLHWTRVKRIALETFDDETIDRFKRHLGRCDCRPYGRSDRRSILAGARSFLRYLRTIGMVSTRPKDKMPALLAEFSDWMQSRRGTSPAVLYNYGLVIRDLLETLGEDPTSFSAHNLRRFVLVRTPQSGIAKAKMRVTALRAFVRFLIATGKSPIGLDDAIPSVAGWRHTVLPRYLPEADIERLINSCDPTQKVGLRDRAIILILARLGLRAGDILHLRLTDIDWAGAWISVSGKSRRETLLPLSQEVGNALVVYIRKARPKSEADTLFLRSRAPFRGFANHCAVSAIVARVMRRADVVAPCRGAAHLLRHSAATSMLRHGASLQEIAVILRHRSVATTEIYAKVDVEMLRQVVQPWPGTIC